MASWPRLFEVDPRCPKPQRWKGMRIAHGHEIKTSFDKPPIPTTSHDWSAVLGGYDAGDPIGYGFTEIEAITNLLNQLGD